MVETHTLFGLCPGNKATETNDTLKLPGDCPSHENSSPNALVGVTAGTTGLNGVGKIISPNTTIECDMLDIGIADPGESAKAVHAG